MAKLTFRTGKRGRPMQLDTDQLLEDFYKYLPQAKASLASFRQESSGINTPELLGTKTSLPEWLDASIDALASFSADNISLEMARTIKEDLRITKRLASRRVNVRTTALEERITKQYMEDLDTAIKYGSKYAKSQYKQIKELLKQATPQQRTQFFKSKKYQDVGSFRNLRYNRIKAWAEASTGETLSYKDSYAYLIAERAISGLDTAGEIKAEANQKLLNDLLY